MPIKLDNKLPALDVLRSENVFIMDENRASSQDIRPMEVLILCQLKKLQKLSYCVF